MLHKRFERRPVGDLPRHLRGGWTGQEAQQVAVSGVAARDQGFDGEAAPQVRCRSGKRPRQRHSAGQAVQTGHVRMAHSVHLLAHDQ